MNDRKRRAEEIAGLGNVRVQKVFGLFNSILVMELYSNIHKRLYLVIDQNPNTKTVHVQRNRPVGFKTKSMLTALLSKYAESGTLRFFCLDEDGNKIAGEFVQDEQQYTIMIESSLQVAVGLFRDSVLLASMKKGLAPSFERGLREHKTKRLDLLENEKAALLHEKRVLNYHRKALFEQRLARVLKELNKKKALQKNVMGDYQKCQRSLELEKMAELIKQNLHLIKRGIESVDVVDYESGQPVKKTIRVDKTLSPQQMIEKIFNRVKRAKRGIHVIEPRLLTIKSEIEKLENEVEQLKRIGPDGIDLADITEDFGSKQKQHKHQRLRLPYRVYESSDGIQILVGRSAKDSDALTVHHCRGNEWWFHAKDVAGAHVVVKSIVDALPATTLLEAAQLAMHFSKAKSDTHATIQYTRGKYVRKLKHVAEGTVVVAREKTIEVASDPQALRAILARERVKSAG